MSTPIVETMPGCLCHRRNHCQETRTPYREPPDELWLMTITSVPLREVECLTLARKLVEFGSL